MSVRKYESAATSAMLRDVPRSSQSGRYRDQELVVDDDVQEWL
jgi:hypothetical protein